MLPFIAFIIFQMPCAVTSVIVLYISIGTDLLPAIALAYEPGELDLMIRAPRNKEDHMVTLTLMAQAYGYQGWIEFWGGMFAYYVIFNDFGFPPGQIQMTANQYMVQSNPTDVYNPTHPTFGNTYLFSKYMTSCPTFSAASTDPMVAMVDWVYTSSSTYDLRNTMLNCNMSTGVPVYTQVIQWGTCNIQQISPYTNLPACFTTEGCKYAQGGYFIAIVLGQIFNAFVCKTRKLSTLSQGVSNTFLLFSITT
jgi:sodium/potassium-transporting ATPase subunit alpha